MLQKRREMTEAQRSEAAQRLLDELMKDPVFMAAETIGLYHPLPYELDTRPTMAWCWQIGKRVALPRYQANNIQFFFVEQEDVLVRGGFNIQEPQARETKKARELAYLCVPSLAIDEDNYRVGYGKGAYDKFLAEGSVNIGKIMYLAFAEATVASCLPTKYDVKADGRYLV